MVDVDGDDDDDVERDGECELREIIVWVGVVGGDGEDEGMVGAVARVVDGEDDGERGRGFGDGGC